MAGVDLMAQYPALGSLLFYGAICLLKVLMMAVLTMRQRITKKIFANEEDAARLDKAKVTLTDVDVERLRRNHLNDLENAPIFFLLGLCYVLTYPNPTVAMWHFRVFTVSRNLHTVTYQRGMQPYRGILFLVGLCVNFSMGIQVILALL